MKATVVNFRISRHRQKPNHIILKIPGFTSREKANDLLGKVVSWKSPAGKEITGEVKAVHGNKGAVRAIFERGLPGQAVGSTVEVK